jgi:glycosyltransferase involved in cell wall biosynthesis
LVSERKKILILIDWFYPGFKAGGPIQSVINLVRLINQDYDIYILTTDIDHGEKSPYPGLQCNCWQYSQLFNAEIYYASKKTISPQQIKEQIAAVNPDFVYLNHLFSPLFVVYPLWFMFCGKIKAEVILCPRGALYDSALAVKPYKKMPFLWVFKKMGLGKKITFQATNIREQQAILKYFPNSKIKIADNIPDILQKPFETIEKSKGVLNCVFISRIVPIKNLLFCLQVLQKVNSKIHFTIAGPIEDENYWNSCKNEINKLQSNIKVDYIGALTNQDVASTIQRSHLFFLPTKGENFGHSIFESFLAGRPVLISDQTPWLHLKEKKIGWDFALDDIDDFVSIITMMAKLNQQEFDEMAFKSWKFACNFIKNPTIKNNYINLFS